MNINDVLNDERFPLALESAFVANPDSNEDMIMRAGAIVDLWIGETVERKKVLDFGCGQGHLSEEMQSRGAEVTAYDLVTPSYIKNSKFTSNWEEVESNGPYDLVIVYDVLDHAEKESPVDLLKKISKVITKQSTVRIRCHPWCSRHGTHIFHKKNKAFLHVLFSEDVLKESGINGIPTLKVIHPLATYQQWFNESQIGGIMAKKVHRRDVEKRFWDAPMRQILSSHWRNSPFDEGLRNGSIFPESQLSFEFVDWTIKKVS